MSSKTIFDKLWDQHVIAGNEGEPQLLYIDLHVIHEVTSPQAFQGLREAGRRVRRKDPRQSERHPVRRVARDTRARRAGARQRGGRDLPRRARRDEGAGQHPCPCAAGAGDRAHPGRP